MVKRKRTSLRKELSAHLQACHPREGGASQPHLDDFAAMSSSENVRHLKKSYATIKRHLKFFEALEKGYSRNLHGFFDLIKTFVQRLDDVIVFLDSENKVYTDSSGCDQFSPAATRRGSGARRDLGSVARARALRTIGTTTRRGQEHHREEQRKTKQNLSSCWSSRRASRPWPAAERY